MLRNSCLNTKVLTILPTASMQKVRVEHCTVLAPLITSYRNVTTGAGRGDLCYSIVLGTRNNRRKNGPQRGIKDISQCTQPESGKLEMRQRMLHLLNEYASCSNELYRPACNSWVYLIPSFVRCVETGLSDKLYRKLLSSSSLVAATAKNNSSQQKNQFSTLTSSEQRELDNARRMFYYELHQRIVLLEDSLPHAQLAQLIQWPALFQRVWITLPIMTHCTETAENEKLTQEVLPFASHTYSNNSLVPSSANTPSISPSCSSSSSLTSLQTVREHEMIEPLSLCELPHLAEHSVSGHRTQRSRNTLPFAKQVYDLPERIAKLTEQVLEIVQSELAQVLMQSSHSVPSFSSSLEENKNKPTEISVKTEKSLAETNVHSQVQIRLAQSQAKKWNDSIIWHVQHNQRKRVNVKENGMLTASHEHHDVDDKGKVKDTNKLIY